MSGFVSMVRDAFLPSEELDDRKRVVAALDLVKIAAAVTAAVTALIFVATPGIFTASILGLTAYTAYEISTVMNNIKKIYTSVWVETASRVSYENLHKQVTKGAAVFRTILVLGNLKLPAELILP